MTVNGDAADPDADFTARLASVGEIVREEPDEALKVLQTWLAQGA